MKILAIGDFQGEIPTKLKKKIDKEDFDLVVGVGDYTGIKEFYPFIMNHFKLLQKGKEPISATDFFGKRKLKALEKKDFEAGKKVLSYLNSLGKPVLAIFGNTDDGWYRYTGRYSLYYEKKKGNYAKKMENISFMTYSKKKYADTNFIGFGGYMDIEAYFKEKTFKIKNDRGRIRKRLANHKKMSGKFYRLIRSASEGKKVFVLHYPPYGVFDIIRNKKNPMDGKSSGIKFFSDGIKKYKPALVFCGHMAEYQGMKKLYGVPVVNPGAAHHGKAAIVEFDNGKIKGVRFIR